MTGSVLDFKSRQQLWLNHFEELWSAAAPDELSEATPRCEKSEGTIRSILQLQKNVLDLYCVGFKCFQSNLEYMLCGDEFSVFPFEMDFNSAEIEAEDSETSKVFGNEISDFAHLPEENIHNLPFDARFFVSFPLTVEGGVQGCLYLADAASRIISSEQVSNVKLTLKILADSIDRRNSFVSHADLDRIKTQMSRLRAIIEGATGEIFIIDILDKSLIVANQQARNNIGYPNEEIRGLLFSDICAISAEDLESYVELLLKGQLRKYACEAHFFRKDGTSYPVMLELVVDENGPDQVVVAFVRDISLRTQRQAELEQLSSLHRATLSTSLEMGFGMEAVFAESGEIIDFVLRQVELGRHANEEFNEKTLVGTRLLQMFPFTQESGLFEKLVHTVQNSGLEVFEQEFKLGIIQEWLSISAIRVGKDLLRLGVRFITPQKRRDGALMKLHELSANMEISTDEYVQNMLATGRIALGMELAQICDIEGDSISIKAVDSELDCVKVGDRILIKDTYYARFNVLDKPVFLRDLEVCPNSTEKLGSASRIGAYAAAPIIVFGDVKSYVSFMSQSPREGDYDEYEIGLISLIARLISQRKMLEQTRMEVESHRDELQLIFDNVPARIWRKDYENRYLKVNKSAARVMGTTPEKIEGLTLGDMRPEIASRLWELDRKVLETGEPLLGLEMVDDFDSGSWASVDVVAVKGKGDQKPGLLVISSDITARKKAESELANVAAELESVNSSLEQFNAIVSHDLKAPLRHMRMLSELLIECIEPSSTAAGYAKHIYQSANHCQAMIDAIMALTRVSKVELIRSPTNLEQTVLVISNLLSDELAAIGGKIICHTLPTIMVDAELTSNLFQNLIENAIKYRSEDPLIIEIEADTSGHVPVFSIKDNGMGIDPKYSESIFQIFVRLSSEKSTEDGDGVGLSICRRIVERHAGKIWLDTSYTAGACFKFTLCDGAV